MSRKRGKMAFRDLRNAKNAEKCVSNPSESQKMQKNARRRPTKRRKREKTLIVGRRNAKNARKCPSSADETRKTRKSAHRRSTKCRKREKVLVVGRRNAKNAKKCPSSVDETQKMLKNSLSYPFDEQKTLKTAFRRGTINKKRQKQSFVGVRRTENAENRLSAAADE